MNGTNHSFISLAIVWDFLSLRSPVVGLFVLVIVVDDWWSSTLRGQRRLEGKRLINLAGSATRWRGKWGPSAKNRQFEVKTLILVSSIYLQQFLLLLLRYESVAKSEKCCLPMEVYLCVLFDWIVCRISFGALVINDIFVRTIKTKFLFSFRMFHLLYCTAEGEKLP